MALDLVDQENSFKDDHELRGLAREFAQFCTLELERRRNSEPEFDDTLYEEAVELGRVALTRFPRSEQLVRQVQRSAGKAGAIR